MHLAFNIGSSRCPSACLHPTTLYGIKSNAVWLEQLVTKIHHAVKSKTKHNSEQHGFLFSMDGSSLLGSVVFTWPSVPACVARLPDSCGVKPLGASERTGHALDDLV